MADVIARFLWSVFFVLGIPHPLNPPLHKAFYGEGEGRVHINKLCPLSPLCGMLHGEGKGEKGVRGEVLPRTDPRLRQGFGGQAYKVHVNS